MTTTAYQLQAFLQAIEGIYATQDHPTLSIKSKDYFWYSPLLQQTPGNKLDDELVKPRDQAELLRVAAPKAPNCGVATMAVTDQELTTAGLPPAFECGWNHTTLMALRQDRSWTNLQTIHSWPLDIEQIEQHMQHWGDEVLMHHDLRVTTTARLFLACR